MDMPCVARDGSRVWVNLASRVFQVQGLIIDGSTRIALVSPCIIVATLRTGALDEAIGKKRLVFLTVGLSGCPLNQAVILI